MRPQNLNYRWCQFACLGAALFIPTIRSTDDAAPLDVSLKGIQTSSLVSWTDEIFGVVVFPTLDQAGGEVKGSFSFSFNRLKKPGINLPDNPAGCMMKAIPFPIANKKYLLTLDLFFKVEGRELSLNRVRPDPVAHLT